jgi:hypothetical protein
MVALCVYFFNYLTTIYQLPSSFDYNEVQRIGEESRAIFHRTVLNLILGDSGETNKHESGLLPERVRF